MTDYEIIRTVLKNLYDSIEIETLYTIRDQLEKSLNLHNVNELYNFEVNYAVILQDFKLRLDKFLSSFSELTELTEIEELKEVINKLAKTSQIINYFNAI